MSVRKVLLSPDHSIFAYNTEREGMEYGELHFKDLNDRPDWEASIVIRSLDPKYDAPNSYTYYF